MTGTYLALSSPLGLYNDQGHVTGKASIGRTERRVKSDQCLGLRLEIESEVGKAGLQLSQLEPC